MICPGLDTLRYSLLSASPRAILFVNSTFTLQECTEVQTTQEVAMKHVYAKTSALKAAGQGTGLVIQVASVIAVIAALMYISLSAPVPVPGV